MGNGRGVIFECFCTQPNRFRNSQGRQEGEQRGKREILQRLLTRKFGRVPDNISTKLEQLSLEQLGEIAEAIIDISALEELEHLLG